MTFALHGLPCCNGIAVGTAYCLSHTMLEVSRFSLPAHAIQAEQQRLNQAVMIVRQELEALDNDPKTQSVAEIAAFVQLHRLFLEDPLLIEAAHDIIQQQQTNAEWALVTQMAELVEQFDAIENPYLRERRQDIVQIVERLLKSLKNGEQRDSIPSGSETHPLIIIAHDVSPPELLQFRNHNIAGFVTEVGATTSHTAIVARSLRTPSILSINPLRQIIRNGDQLILDGQQGMLIVNPSEAILEEYRLRLHAFNLRQAQLKRLTTTVTRTLDDIDVSLQANIEFPADAEQAIQAGAKGIGLFRSEFLFMNRSDYPSEDEQYEAYRHVVIAMAGHPVTIRTLDAGGDKSIGTLSHKLAANPALGLRGIRFCLAEPQLFMTQLRALLRASAHGAVRILIPLLTQASEIEQTLSYLARAKTELSHEGKPFDTNTAIGGMIEVPAAVLSLPLFTRRLDFLSIGTNDLIQYTLAIDRGEESVSHLYDPLHPALLRLIAMTIRAGRRAHIPVSLCGQLAGESHLTRILLGLGLRQLSMPPGQMLEVKQTVLQTPLAHVRPLVQQLLREFEPEQRSVLIQAIQDC